MSNNSVNNKVLIIGAGPGGLALAQILRKQSIPFEIFERDDNNHVRKQGWAVAIVEGLAALDGLLPDDIEDLEICSVNHSVGVQDEFAILHADTAQELTRLGGVSKGQEGYLLRVDRDGLRKVLWKHIDVTLGKHFDHYVEDADGVTAYFKDGSHARGAILVGADGAHSHVRAQLMAGTPHDPVLSEYIPLLGEINLTPAQYEPLRACATAVIIAGRKDLRFLLGQRWIEADMSSAAWYYAAMYKSTNPQADSAWAAKASKEELFQKILEVTEGMHPMLLDPIVNGGPDSVVTPPLKLYEFVPPDNLPVSRVTLMGDAAHAMIPFKAAGANTALMDSADLATTLAAHFYKDGPVDWLAALQEYEAKMLPRGQEKVLASRAAGRGDDFTAAARGRVATHR